MVAWLDLDGPVEAGFAVGRGVVAAVALAVDDLLAFVGRGQECIAATDRHRAEPAMRAELHSLAAGRAEVLEIPEPGLAGQDEEDVVMVVGAEQAGAPVGA